NGKVVDGAAIVRRVDDRRGFGREAGEILARRQSRNVEVRRQKRLQRDRGCGLADAHEACGDLVELLMDGLEGMPRVKKIGDPVERLIGYQDGAQQRLLQLDVVRSGAVRRPPL